ncbi:MAG TPA: bifunctional transaldolase/phosoglucose isomerase [Thermoanaerobaculia bacterium]|nr:bifunctional transaldolase/phosoglucose isomerase [Thermoanaerobaculia bacterium]
MSSNPLAELAKTGQSVWYDQMERKLITTGKLQQMIDDDDLRGMTSNPTIFEKAIGGSDDYDGQLRMLASQNKSRDEIYDELVIDDIGKAADIFRPVYDKTHGDDGFVSPEVSPLLARDTAGTVAEAKRLFARLGRPNVMIKIPATSEGIPAIEESIAAGININVTLIFSNDVYAQVIEAYLRGLERRVANGEPVGDIASVASFFVSRIDTLADKEAPESLQGKVAIANAKLAYQLFKQIFSSPRFLKLRDQGARVQRPLWASTGTKNPKYSDVLYIESLIGPDTVNTIPPATYEAFKDHGRVIMTLEQGVADAQRVLDEFGADKLAKITEKLTADGVKSFDESFNQLMGTIEARRDAALRGLPERITLHNVNADEAIQRAEKEKFVSRIWAKDKTLFNSKDELPLGWLTAPEDVQMPLPGLIKFAESLKGEFTHAVVLGMGGSSLCSEVTRRVFGKREGYPELLVLDSTVPEAVSLLEEKLDLARTLFIVASKSGTTTEPVMFHRYFYDRVRSVQGDRAGRNFIAITDAGTKMVADAKRDGFREIFINMPDIGGRYSALSLFGIVPAAIAGYDVTTLVERAVHAAHIASSPAVRKNPAALLGCAIGGAALAGRDKLTLITPRPLDTLGLWVEQLIAESTGKEGKGIVPVAIEPELPADAYANDRLFVAVRLRGSDITARLRELTAAGHPVIDFVLEDPLDLGECFYVWEFATAVAGALLGINAFDQPNVESAKKITRELLAGTMQVNGSQISIDDGDAIRQLLAQVKPGDYVALQNYFAETPKRDELLAQVRETIARELRVATTSGYGPRFLHSTGQLHKGGKNNGVFLQLTGGPGDDVPIPGDEGLTFGKLVRAQAEGDYQALVDEKRRLQSIDLGSSIDGGLQTLLEHAAAKVKA